MKLWANVAWDKPLLWYLVNVPVFTWLIIQSVRHELGGFGTETDFYHYFGPGAQAILNGRLPDDPFHPPGYALMLAIIGIFVPTQMFYVAKALSLLTMGGVMIYCREHFRIHFGPVTALFGPALLCLSGPMAVYAMSATSDMLFLFFLVAATSALCNYQTWNARKAVVSGIVVGLAILIRYNGVCLLAGLGIIMFYGNSRADMSERPLRRSFLLGLFFTMIPWMIISHLAYGMPFMNRNYLNIATQYFPEHSSYWVDQDGTRTAAKAFGSLADVLTRDPRRIAIQYPIVLLSHFTASFDGGLMHSGIAVLSLLGILAAARRRRRASFGLIVMVFIMAANYALVALSHWEARYHLYTIWCAVGLALYAIESSFDEVLAGSRVVPALVCVALLAFAWVRASGQTSSFLAEEPRDLLQARAVVLGAARAGSVMARKPHLAFLTGESWQFLPLANDLPTLCWQVDQERPTWLFVHRQEGGRRPAIIDLFEEKYPMVICTEHLNRRRPNSETKGNDYFRGLLLKLVWQNNLDSMRLYLVDDTGEKL